jgi:hypothetical protein
LSFELISSLPELFVLPARLFLQIDALAPSQCWPIRRAVRVSYFLGFVMAVAIKAIVCIRDIIVDNRIGNAEADLRSRRRLLEW